MTVEHNVQGFGRKDYGGIRGWHVGEVKGSKRSHGPFGTNVFHFEEVSDED